MRIAMLQGLGGAALLVGIYLSWRQVHLSRQGQITERFTRAVSQLGEATADVRLGGVYALERIALDSKPDRPTVQEVICAYVRLHAPTHHDLNESAPDQEHSAPAGARLRVRAADVQAALTVLGRFPQDSHEKHLERIDARGADLFGARLAGADLHYADLSDSILVNADLRGADLTGAMMQDAALINANFYQADLRTASLQRARLDYANVRAGDLSGADLRDARLTGTHLEQADLRGANLSTVDLSKTFLKGAVADETTRWPAQFDPETAGVLSGTDLPPIRPQRYSEIGEQQAWRLSSNRPLNQK
ncbi:MAG TPA: pentapeptide repeat-containing protein [Candidatus Limnocylindrales bacterium]|nr:pentapeptide repeat-containing protein [Candidatus Limnocylindrales bacterium]